MLERVQSMQRGPSWDSNHGPSHRDVRLLTATPLCSPQQYSEIRIWWVSGVTNSGRRIYGTRGRPKAEDEGVGQRVGRTYAKASGSDRRAKSFKTCVLVETNQNQTSKIWQWKWDTPETCGEAWGWGGAESFSANPICLPTTNCVSYFILEFFPNS